MDDIGRRHDDGKVDGTLIFLHHLPAIRDPLGGMIHLDNVICVNRKVAVRLGAPKGLNVASRTIAQGLYLIIVVAAEPASRTFVEFVVFTSDSHVAMREALVVPRSKSVSRTSCVSFT